MSATTTIRLSGIIIQGNATYPDPLSRLKSSFSTSLTKLYIKNGFFLPYGDASPSVYHCEGCLTQLFVAFNLAELTISGCQFYSTIAGLAGALRPGTVLLDLSNNNLTGTIPVQLLVDAASSIRVDLSQNLFYGALPSGLFTHMSSVVSPSLDLSSNNISGSIPSDFLDMTVSTQTSSIKIVLDSNRLSGSLPSSSFFGLPESITPMTSVSFSAAYNQISGDIPPNFLASMDWSSLVTFNLNLAGNLLNSNLSSSLFAFPVPLLNSFTMTLDSNPLAGTISSGLFSSVGNDSARTAASLRFQLSVGSALLAGSLEIAPASRFGSTPITIFNLLAPGNLLTSLTIQESFAPAINTLVLSANSQMTGTLPNSLFSTSSILQYLQASSTSLSGTMPDITGGGPPVLEQLLLASTAIDFCEDGRSNWTAPSSFNLCDLTETNVYQCRSLYPSVCTASLPPPTVAPPLSPLRPSPIPTMAPVSCTSTSPLPLESWECIDGVWTSIGSVDVPTLTIPSGSTETVVTGNLTSSSVVITGTGSTLVLQGGCPTNLTTITITLTDEDLKQIGKTLSQALLVVNLNLSCSGLNDIGVNTHVLGSSCRKVTTSKTVSSGTISALFSVSSSSCNTWWIILVSVLVPVVVILVLVVVLLVIFVPSVRNFFRPYSARKASKGSVS